MKLDPEIASTTTESEPTYCYSLLGLGPVYIHLLYIGLLGLMFYIYYQAEKDVILFAILSFHVIFMGADILHMFRPSPFQISRKPIRTYFWGTYNSMVMARYLLYEDGIEIRGYFNAIFIPYDKMEDPQYSPYHKAVVLKHRIKTISSRILLSHGFSGFSNRKTRSLQQTISQFRNAHLKNLAKDVRVAPKGGTPFGVAEGDRKRDE